MENSLLEFRNTVPLKILVFTVLVLMRFSDLNAQLYGRQGMPLVEGNKVTFRISAPEAKKVVLFSDLFPGINEYGLGGNVDMKHGENGMWEYIGEDVVPEFYFYYYEIDGVRTMDPSNLKVAHNFAEYLNTFIVKGEQSRPYEIAESKKGSLTQQWYPSEVIGAERRLNIYLPYGYTTEKKYPVLYLQHGGGDDEETWVDMGRVSQIMDYLIAAGKAEEMIVVLPNSFDNQLASVNVLDPLSSENPVFSRRGGDPDAFRSGGKYVEDLVKCIIPYVESHYSVKAGRENRAISGLSMGGIYTLYTIEKYPELFSFIGIMGSGYQGNEDIDKGLAPIKEKGYNLFWIGCGKTDIAYDSAVRLMEGLDKNNMGYTYFDSLDGHNWRSWRRDLLSMAQKLFK